MTHWAVLQPRALMHSTSAGRRHRIMPLQCEACHQAQLHFFIRGGTQRIIGYSPTPNPAAIPAPAAAAPRPARRAPGP